MPITLILSVFTVWTASQSRGKPKTMLIISSKTKYAFQVGRVTPVPDCPGGGVPDDPLGRQRNTVRTAALFPAQGSTAIGLGAPWKRKPVVSVHR